MRSFLYLVLSLETCIIAHKHCFSLSSYYFRAFTTARLSVAVFFTCFHLCAALYCIPSPPFLLTFSHCPGVIRHLTIRTPQHPTARLCSPSPASTPSRLAPPQLFSLFHPSFRRYQNQPWSSRISFQYVHT